MGHAGTVRKPGYFQRSYALTGNIPFDRIGFCGNCLRRSVVIRATSDLRMQILEKTRPKLKRDHQRLKSNMDWAGLFAGPV